ncbi:FkbM family methyltransferase [Chitinophaga sp. SYP-B3965]|uniref:FkbM family methyltransferase n=1 Tax=Chitinophaga sp. SYP-B3965 TaxID=2663120 RepID=UPI001C12C831|nr:FkbM family methyltransferase [Chitinophaga sp. SYP-B3965]
MINLIYKALKYISWDFKFSEICYSQEGEDMVLQRFLGDKANGFYIDIGAHHPIRFSNTYKFFKRGWRGINIDAMPGSMERFRKLRKEDINLELPLSDKKEVLNYYIFNEKALNTFDETEARKKDGVNGFKITDVRSLETSTLTDVVNKYVPAGQSIDFLSIDIEGYDMKVLKSNDWNKIRPEIVLIEDLNSSIEDSLQGEQFRFMKSVDYKLIARTFNTAFYKNERKN